MGQSKNGERINNRTYGWLREKLAATVSESKKGVKQSPEHIAKRKASFMKTIEARNNNKSLDTEVLPEVN